MTADRKADLFCFFLFLCFRLVDCDAIKTPFTSVEQLLSHLGFQVGHRHVDRNAVFEFNGNLSLNQRTKIFL